VNCTITSYFNNLAETRSRERAEATEFSPRQPSLPQQEQPRPSAGVCCVVKPHKGITGVVLIPLDARLRLQPLHVVPRVNLREGK
jgi:hypothetical protein